MSVCIFSGTGISLDCCMHIRDLDNIMLYFPYSSDECCKLVLVFMHIHMSVLWLSLGCLHGAVYMSPTGYRLYSARIDSTVGRRLSKPEVVQITENFG